MIILEHISKRYRRGREIVCALDDVSLSVGRGELALLRGPSGSGKTTLINICAGLASPTEGRVSVCGQELREIGRRERTRMRARRVAVVFQLFHLCPYLTAYENVLLPTLSNPLPDAGERALSLLGSLGIAHRAEHRPGEMSAGERQRCALARALLSAPEVILADEPTGNLDEESAAVVLTTLGECRKAGAAVLLVSHQHSNGIKPDRVFTIVDGSVSGG